MNDNIQKIGGGVCASAGFRAGAVRAGIKRTYSEKDDLAVVVSEVPCEACGVFTRNVVKAAPVQISLRHLRSRRPCVGVVLNSGNANACTGGQGLLDARECARLAAEQFGGTAEGYLVCSTGRIGVPMPMDKVVAGMAALPAAVSRRGNKAAAVAIMTSDTFPKETAFRIRAGGGRFHVGGMAKGAGMINPDMATMLCVITTDLAIDAPSARKILAGVVGRTFNRITIDGDMSTNDTVLLLANGLSGVDASGDAAVVRAFEAAVERICAELARMILGDGEGTTKVVDILVGGARSVADARRAAEAVANSVLFKCALAGGDPNWGRILDALGYSGARFDPARVDVYYNGERLVEAGEPGRALPARVRKVAALPAFEIRIDLGAGSAEYRAVTTDLTEEYVRLNLSE